MNDKEKLIKLIEHIKEQMCSECELKDKNKACGYLKIECTRVTDD